MKENLISIITPLYNGENYISSTIKSVQNQTNKSWEMIIVNDGSKDNSSKIVKKIALSDSRIKLINQENSGSASARNNGLRNAKGKYISFLDADDLWDKNFLTDQLKFLKLKKAALVFSSYRRIDEQNNIKLKPFIVPNQVTYTDLLKTCSISCLTALYDKDLVGEQYFKEELRSMRDDFVFWLQILKKNKIAYGNKNVLASYRVFETSTTGNKRKVIVPQFNVYYKIEKLGVIKSLFYLINWALNGYKKYKE